MGEYGVIGGKEMEKMKKVKLGKLRTRLEAQTFGEIEKLKVGNRLNQMRGDGGEKDRDKWKDEEMGKWITQRKMEALKL